MPSVRGAVSSPFVHPGHELTVVLNAQEVDSFGGFSLEPDGNEIRISFASLFGDRIDLASRRVQADTASSLTFSFPDSFAEVGRSLAGPVGIRVWVGDREVAHIAPWSLVALPPDTDLTDVLDGALEAGEVAAALGADGDLWVPIKSHGDHMPMPGCEGTFVMPKELRIGGLRLLDIADPRAALLTRLRDIKGYLGDMTINGESFYGLFYPEPIRLVHVAGTLGVSLCRRNDAEYLVLRFRGDRSNVKSGVSPFAQVARDSSPVRIGFAVTPSLPESSQAPADSFGNACPVPKPRLLHH